MLSYRTTPHATTGHIPSELLLGLTVRTRWALLRPSSHDVVIKVQNQMRPAGKHRSFGIHDLVWARDFRPRTNARWAAGEITKVLGPRNYIIKTDLGLWKRRINQLRERTASSVKADKSSAADIGLDVSIFYQCCKIRFLFYRNYKQQSHLHNYQYSRLDVQREYVIRQTDTVHEQYTLF